MKDAIVYTCLKYGRCLAEQRLLDSQYAPGEIVFPGGRVDQSDISVTAAFYRELGEELGITARRYLTGQPLELIDNDIRLHPFLVLVWGGHLPTTILDKGNAVVWQNFDTMKQSNRFEISALANIFYTLAHPVCT